MLGAAASRATTAAPPVIVAAMRVRVFMGCSLGWLVSGTSPICDRYLQGLRDGCGGSVEIGLVGAETVVIGALNSVGSERMRHAPVSYTHLTLPTNREV